MRINNVRKKRRFRELVILLLCMVTAAGLMPMYARAETEHMVRDLDTAGSSRFLH